MKTFLVLGASGDQAASLLTGLSARNIQTRAACRRPDRIPRLSGVEPVRADFDNVSSLRVACHGVDTIVTSLPFVWDIDVADRMAGNIVDAAREQGVRKIVFQTSCVVANEDIGVAAHDARRRIEKRIRGSGLAYVMVRSTVFMDNITRVWLKPSVVNNGIFAYPASEQLKISWVCLNDVTRCMIAVAEDDSFNAHEFLIGGPEVLTGHQVAERLSAVIGRKVRFESLSPEQFARNMSRLVTGSDEVAPHSIYAGMEKFYRWYNTRPVSPLAVDSTVLQAALGIELTPLERWAAHINWSIPD